jgi:hypothetical protein
MKRFSLKNRILKFIKWTKNWESRISKFILQIRQTEFWCSTGTLEAEDDEYESVDQESETGSEGFESERNKSSRNKGLISREE